MVESARSALAESTVPPRPAGPLMICPATLHQVSPSCGLFGVNVYSRESAAPRAAGRGIYAAAISHELPELPLAENGHLDDPDLRENFVTRTYAYAHWRRFAALGTNARGLHTGNSSRLLSAIDGARLNDRSR